MRVKLQAQLKSQPRAHNRAELQERLRLKLEELKGSDKSSSKNKNKKKLTKAEKRSKAKQEKRLKAKLSRSEQKNNLTKVPGGAKPAKPVYNSDGKIVFSKFDFTNGECAIGGGDKKKPVLDPKAALGKIQKHKEKIQSLQAIGKNNSIKCKQVWEEFHCSHFKPTFFNFLSLIFRSRENGESKKPSRKGYMECSYGKNRRS